MVSEQDRQGLTQLFNSNNLVNNVGQLTVSTSVVWRQSAVTIITVRVIIFLMNVIATCSICCNLYSCEMKIRSFFDILEIYGEEFK